MKASWIWTVLRRETSSTDFIPVIDGLRFIAIAFVFLHHLGYYLFDVTTPAEWAAEGGQTWVSRFFMEPGQYGVQLFFVISGFVLALPWAKAALLSAREPALSAYYVRRLTRLEPPFLISLAVYAAFRLFFLTVSPDWGWHLLASALYSHGWFYRAESTINIVTWSLELEVQFYLIAPFMGRAIFRGSKATRRSLMAVLIVAFSALTASGILGEGRLWFTLLRCFQYFLVGFLLADVYLTDWDSRPKAVPLWDALAVLAWGAIVLFWTMLGAAFTMAFPWLIFLAYVGSFRGRLASAALSLPAITATGGMCYTIYLYHALLIAVISRFTSRLTLGEGFLPNYALQLVLIAAGTFTVCAALFLAFEKPFMRRRLARSLRLVGA